MTFYQFNQFPHETQLTAVFSFGTFLATRWQAENEAVNLYALHGFFAELVYDTAVNELLDLRCFTSSAPLEDYTVSVQLPDWMGS